MILFITKINSDGTYDWTKRTGGSLYDRGNSVTTDASGNILTGLFSGTVNFGADWSGTDSKTSAGKPLIY